MNRATVNKIFQKHPVYVKAGMIAVISIIIFGCVYSKDNGKKLEKDEKGREILRRNESGKDELKNMKVKIDEKQEEISISVSGKKYDEEELKNAFSEAEKEVEQAVLGKNKSLDEVRSDLNLITSVPEKNMKVSWELDRYDVMDIQGHLQQDNLSTEGTLIKLTAINFLIIIQENMEKKIMKIKSCVISGQRNLKENICRFFTERKYISGITVIELVLILVIVIALLLIFKTELINLINSIFDKITSESSGI